MIIFLQNCKIKLCVLQFLPKIFIKFLIFTLKNYGTVFDYNKYEGINIGVLNVS